MSDLGEYAVTAELLQRFREIAQQEIASARPKNRYAVVQSIDTVGRSVEVVFNGDTEVVRVPYRSIAPAAVGQVVAIEGNSPDNYLADVAGANSTDVSLAALFEATAADVPWVQPTLGSGCTHVSGNPIRYRAITDRGSTKIQLRGACNVTAAATTIFTLPANLRRAVYTSLVIARNISGGSAVAILGINPNGTMVLDGKTTGVGRNTTTNNTANSGAIDTGSASPNTGQPINSPNWTGYAATSARSGGGTDVASHIHNFDHFHNVNGHVHAQVPHFHGLDAVTAPTSISLDGCEFFL